MDWNLAELPANLRYKLLVGLVVPRPIALLTTRSGAGVVNAAPFSFFNLLGDDPPIVIVSIEDHPDGRLKDSARNVLAQGEFVVNLVDEAIVDRMHACSLDHPPEVSEPDVVGFTLAASRTVGPPRIVEAPAALECRLERTIEFRRRRLFLGEVAWLHCREGIVDPETLRIRSEAFHPVGRFYGNRYVRTRDEFTAEANAYNAAMQALGRT
jgi:flavin reductase (DIM6/NTAB) family NADH-FMN oxidoreductase RutF